MLDFLKAIPWSTLTAQLVIAVITAILSVRLSLRRFRSEKVWEQRLSAYVEVLAALNEMLAVVSMQIRFEEAGRELSKERDTELRARHKAARQGFDRVFAVSRLLLPDSVSNGLREAQEELEGAREYETYYESLDAEYGALKTAIDVVTKAGRTDLQIK